LKRSRIPRSLKLTSDDVRRLDALCQKHGLSRETMLREAFEIGLCQVEAGQTRSGGPVSDAMGALVDGLDGVRKFGEALSAFRSVMAPGAREVFDRAGEVFDRTGIVVRRRP
jgi:hypothetical protein